MPSIEQPLTLSVSLSRKINLGNYESADVFVSVSGITAETPSEEMDQLIETQGALAYRKIAEALKSRIADAKVKVAA